MRKISFAVVLCLLCKVVTAQRFKELSIGDTLPDIMVNYLYGSAVEKVPLKSIYEKKPIILDFWATWCATCIRAISDGDSISKKLNGGFELVPVTYEDKETISKFKSKNKVLQKVNLKFIVGDSVLMGGYFKFTKIPHEVWIDTKGIVKAITYPEEITYEHVQLFINSRPMNLPLKTEDLNFDITKPLNIDNNSIIYRSIATAYKPELMQMFGTLSPSYKTGVKENRFMAINQTILNLFYSAYSQNQGIMNYNRIELKVKDTLSICPFWKGNKVSAAELHERLYCYELILPRKIDKQNFYAYLFDDLNRFFPYKASIEKREMMCWVLYNKDKSKNPECSGKAPKVKCEGGFIKEFTNQTMEVLVPYLNWNMELPVIDESNYKTAFDMELEIGAVAKEGSAYLDFKKVNDSLKKYGFELIKEKRISDMLIIRDKDE